MTMEPETGVERTDNGGRDANSGAGCLTWALGAVVVGVLLSFFSVVYSVDFEDGGIITIGPSGFIAGFPIPFVEFYDGDAGADANDPPSTIFRMYALGGSVSEVYETYAVINAILWVLVTLLVAAFVRWISRLPP
jgi:ABC-type Co2+ transport system permease subunit